MPRLRSPFHFFNYWADHPNFLSLVREVWKEEIPGSPIFQLCSKLKRLKSKLKELNDQNYSDLHGRVVRTKSKLNFLQEQVQASPTDPNLCREEATAAKEYRDICRATENFLRQKYRVQWSFQWEIRTKNFSSERLKAVKEGTRSSLLLRTMALELITRRRLKRRFWVSSKTFSFKKCVIMSL